MAALPKIALHIFLDTNALFTEAADCLVAFEISEFILGSLNNDLSIRWYIPSVVTGERRFQMLDRAKRLLPHLEKVERLLGHHLGITNEVLAARVDDAIRRQIDAHRLIEIGFDHTNVDWQEMVRKSISREPPFEGGESEKGFRDAIVLETFFQRVSELPKSSQVCRIILLSNDERLVEAAQERMTDRSNVIFAKNLDAVRTVLNALASEISQEVVNSLLPTAAILFFELDNQKSLYYSAGVADKIRATFSKELQQVPNGSTVVSTKAINIVTPPTFLIKEGQKITFSTRIIYRQEATRYVQRPAEFKLPASGLSGTMDPGSLGTSATIGTFLGTGALSGVASPAGLLGTLAAGRTPPQYDEIKREGEIVFEAEWSATLTARGKLTRPKFSKVDHRTTNWKE